MNHIDRPSADGIAPNKDGGMLAFRVTGRNEAGQYWMERNLND